MPAPTRWPKSKKLAYCLDLVQGLARGARTGEKQFPVYITRLHVHAHFKDAMNPEGEPYFGYGIAPAEFGAPSDWTVEQALDYVDDLWVAYVQVVYPMHPQTPGSEKYREAEEQGNPHTSLEDPWKGWT